MLNIFPDKLNFNTVTDENKKYLVLKLNSLEKESLIDYQVNMILSNKRNSIILFEIFRKDNEASLYYDITGLVPLCDFLNTNKLKKQDFIKRLKGIAECILNNSDILLYESGYILLDEYLYVDSQTDAVYIIYIPVLRDIDFNSAFKEFLITIFAKVHISDLKENDIILKELITFIKTQNFTLYDFNKFLDDYQSASISSQDPDRRAGIINEVRNSGKDNTHNQFVSSIKDNNLKKDVIHKKSKHLKEDKTLKSHRNNTQNINDEDLNKDKAILKDGITKQNGESEKNISAGKQVPLMLAAAFQIALICWSVVIERFMNKRGVSSWFRYLLISVLIIIIDILIFKFIILNKSLKGTQKLSSEAIDNNKIRKQKAGRNEYNMDSIKSSMRRNMDLNNTDYEGKQYVENGEMQLEKCSMSFMEEGNISESFMCEPVLAEDAEKRMHDELSSNYKETTLLASKNSISAYLVPEGEEEGLRSKITEEPFLIGRNPDICNLVINERTVGRVHAQIQFKENSFFLSDKGSVNGTALNGEAVEPGVEYKLGKGDSIQFSDVKYNFIC